MIVVEELTPAHVQECLEKGYIKKELADRIVSILPGKNAALRNGSVLAMGGMTKVWPGVGVAWLTVMPGAKFHPVRLVRNAFDLICDAVEDYKLHRLHIEVKADDPKAVRLARMLGFEYESTMRNYGPDGADYMMMTWQPLAH